MKLAKISWRWRFNETRDPSAEAVTEIVKALRKLDEAAAREFVELYLRENWEDEV